MNAFDLRTELGELYRPRPGTPVIVSVPAIDFLMIDGTGTPAAAPGYADAIATLYPVVYTLKFSAKERGADFRVMPLETLWWSEDGVDLDVSDPESWRWTAMIAVPPWIEQRDVVEALSNAARKRPLPVGEPLRLERFHEGRSVQVMHIGPYGDEAPTIAAMLRFADDRGLAPVGKHHEIYLSDPRRTAPERLKTIVRIPLRRVRARRAA